MKIVLLKKFKGNSVQLISHLKATQNTNDFCKPKIRAYHLKCGRHVWVNTFKYNILNLNTDTINRIIYNNGVCIQNVFMYIISASKIKSK